MCHLSISGHYPVHCMFKCAFHDCTYFGVCVHSYGPSEQSTIVFTACAGHNRCIVHLWMDGCVPCVVAVETLYMYVANHCPCLTHSLPPFLPPSQVVQSCDRMVTTGQSYTEACRVFSTSLKGLASHFKDDEVVAVSSHPFHFGNVSKSCLNSLNYKCCTGYSVYT